MFFILAFGEMYNILDGQDHFYIDDCFRVSKPYHDEFQAHDVQERMERISRKAAEENKFAGQRTEYHVVSYRLLLQFIKRDQKNPEKTLRDLEDFIIKMNAKKD
jgi:hypothetical protein